MTGREPPEILKPIAIYEPSPDLPHFSQHRFPVPSNCLTIGVVIFSSGMIASPSAQPVALALTREFLFLGAANGGMWWRPWGDVRSETIADVSGLTVPLTTPEGRRVDMHIPPEAKGISIRYQGGFREQELLLVTLHPSHAYEWLHRIRVLRERYDEGLRRGGLQDF